MSDISILLVEDTPADMACIRGYLSTKETIVTTLKEAQTLQSALSLMAHYDFDAVLLDLDLPDSSGFETARRIIVEYSELAVIVLSDPDNEAAAVHAVRYGAEDYLKKSSLSPEVLHKSINYSIKRKRIQQEKYDILSDLILALERIEELENALPICTGCKKIYHEGSKRWINLDKYLHEQSNSGGPSSPVCPDCQAQFNSDS